MKVRMNRLACATWTFWTSSASQACQLEFRVITMGLILSLLRGLVHIYNEFHLQFSSQAGWLGRGTVSWRQKCHHGLSFRFRWWETLDFYAASSILNDHRFPFSISTSDAGFWFQAIYVLCSELRSGIPVTCEPVRETFSSTEAPRISLPILHTHPSFWGLYFWGFLPVIFFNNVPEPLELLGLPVHAAWRDCKMTSIWSSALEGLLWQSLRPAAYLSQDEVWRRRLQLLLHLPWGYILIKHIVPW